MPPLPQVDHAGRGGPPTLPHRERELPLVPRLDRPAAGQHEGPIRGHVLPVPQGHLGTCAGLPAPGPGRRPVPHLPRGLRRGRAPRGPRRRARTSSARPATVPRLSSRRRRPTTSWPTTGCARSATGRPPGRARAHSRARASARSVGGRWGLAVRHHASRPSCGRGGPLSASGATGATGRGPPGPRMATDGPTRPSPPSAEDGTHVAGPASACPRQRRGDGEHERTRPGQRQADGRPPGDLRVPDARRRATARSSTPSPTCRSSASVPDHDALRESSSPTPADVDHRGVPALRPRRVRHLRGDRDRSAPPRPAIGSSRSSAAAAASSSASRSRPAPTGS